MVKTKELLDAAYELIGNLQKQVDELKQQVADHNMRIENLARGKVDIWDRSYPRIDFYPITAPTTVPVPPSFTPNTPYVYPDVICKK